VIDRKEQKRYFFLSTKTQSFSMEKKSVNIAWISFLEYEAIFRMFKDNDTCKDNYRIPNDGSKSFDQR